MISSGESGVLGSSGVVGSSGVFGSSGVVGSFGSPGVLLSTELSSFFVLVVTFLVTIVSFPTLSTTFIVISYSLFASKFLKVYVFSPIT